jgi:hypothetical protein
MARIALCSSINSIGLIRQIWWKNMNQQGALYLQVTEPVSTLDK